MSTYTHIQTQIRDRQTMYRVLSSIPGATVEPNAVIPAKAGGYLQTAFRVVVPNSAINAEGFFSSLFQGGVREFWVYENPDGTLWIEISHDIGAEHQVENAVTNALNQEQQRQNQWAAEQERLRQQQREQQRQQEIQRQRERQQQLQKEQERSRQEAQKRKLAEEQRRKAEAEQRIRFEEEKRAEEAARQQEAEARRKREREEAAREAEMIAEQLAGRQQQASPPATNDAAPPPPEPPAEAVREEALDILKRLQQQAGPSAQETEQQRTANDQAPPPDPGLTQDLNDAIAQEYSRQLVMEKIEEVKTIYGINLKEINQMEDGSIKIRLQG